jgi:hypothetical protein
MSRTVYYISDGTGISAKTLGHSLITQFEQINFKSVTLSYINTKEKAIEAAKKIDESLNTDKNRPIVFVTIVKPEVRSIITESSGFVIDFFHNFISLLEQELKVPSAEIVGLSHALIDDEKYNARIEAVNFALQCDDGVNTHAYRAADIILTGVSRTGKTPTSLYLALQFGVRTANYPLTEEDLQHPHLPKALIPHRERLLGLTTSPERLHQTRTKRLPQSQYSSKNQCESDIRRAEALFLQEKIPYLDSTYLSVEEMSAHILGIINLKSLNL